MTRERWQRTPNLEPASDRHELRFPSSVELAQGLPLVSDPYIGRTVGPCLIEELLGEGAFGRVYRAHHLRLQAPVALKLLTQVTAPKALARFKREAQAAARLVDRNVVKVYELGVNERVPFIVQELVEGQSLTEAIEGGPLKFETAIRLGCGIASGLQAIHAAGLVHRDLKPDNVMITPDGEPKIVDFGLVRVIGDEGGFTSEGLLMGTPAFIAPEQIKPKGEGCDQKADLFALGCVLYLLLTGEVPHMEDEEGTLIAFLARRMAGPPRPVQELRAKIPNTLARMIAALLDIDPANRPGAQQALGILEVIDEELSGEQRPLRSSRFPARRGGSSTRLPAVKRKSSARQRRKSSGRLPTSNAGSSRHRRAAPKSTPKSSVSHRAPASRSGSGSNRASARSRRLPAGYRAPSDMGGVHQRRRQVVVISALGALGVLALALAMFGTRSKPQVPKQATARGVQTDPTAPTRTVAAGRRTVASASTAAKATPTSSVRRAAPISSRAGQPSSSDAFFPIAQRAGELERAGRLWEAILLYRGYLARHPKGPGATRARTALTTLASRLKQHLDADLAKLSEQLKAGRRDEAVELLLKTVGKYGGPEAANALKTLARQLEDQRERRQAKTVASVSDD